MQPKTLFLLVAALCCLRSTAAGETVRITIDPAEFSWVAVEDGQYRADLRSAHRAGIPGAPDVPAISVRILPPTGQRLNEVTIVGSQSLLEHPPGPLARFHGGAGSTVAARQYPPLVQKMPGGYRRGEAVDGVVIFPVQPEARGGVALFSEITLELSFVPDRRTGVVSPLRGASVSPLPFRGERVVSLKSGVSPTPLPLVRAGTEPLVFSPRARPSLDGSAVPYVIVTVDALESSLEPLAEWRTQTGLPAVIRTMEWINSTYAGIDAAERLRFFIRDAVTYWGTQYILLAGDNPLIPIRYGTTTFYGGDRIPTDLYFQCLDGSWNDDGDDKFGEAETPQGSGDNADIVADVWLGRLPVRSTEEVETLTAKIFNYEKGLHSAPNSALVLAEVLFPPNWIPGGHTYIDGATLGDTVSSILDQKDYSVRKLYENYVPFQGAQPETLSTVLDELNRGAGIVLHVGHGSYLSMSVGLGGKTLTRPLADGVHNSESEFFLYSVNCTSAALDFDAIAKHFIRNPRGGAFGGVGSTRFDFPGASDPYDRSFFQFAVLEEMSLGEALANAKLVELTTAHQETADRWTTMTLVLLSDPAVHLWTSIPKRFVVSHAPEAMQGDGLPVSVSGPEGPVAGAHVIAYRPDALWVSVLTDEAGQALVPMNSIEAGAVTLTVTDSGYAPFQDTVSVTTQTQSALPVLTGTRVGENDGTDVRAGHHEIVTWLLTNQGSDALTGIQMAPQSSLEFTYLSGPSTMWVGEENAFSFAVTVPASVPDLETLGIQLQVEADQGVWNLSTALQVTAPVLDIYRLDKVELSGNGNSVIDFGEEFALDITLINVGTGDAAAEDVFLAPVEGGEVLVGSIALGGISAGSVVRVEGFQVRAQAAFPIFKLNYGSSHLNSALDLMPPDPPGVISTTGGTEAITLTWIPADSLDVARYVVESSADKSGPFTRISPWGLSESATYVDAPLPGLAVRYYRIASQDESGNLSEFSAPIRATTGLAQRAGFPISCGVETGTSPLAVDLDGDGRLEIITGGDQIYAVHADGTELIDGDQDVRTEGVFTNLEGEVGFFAAPAVADLDGDGRLEIVGVLAKRGVLGIWDAKGVPFPGWPQTVETFGGSVWVQSSPTLFDFDGDGDLEIALHAGTAVYVFHHDGREFLDGDRNPATKGVFFQTNSIFTYTSPAAWDLDGDGKQELIVAARSGYLYVLEPDGSSRPGFPLIFGGELTSSPVVADLDGNGSSEIIFGSGGQNSPGPDSIEVRQIDGSSLPGWPQPVLMNQDISSSPAIADWDDDGDFEVCIVSGNTTVYLWNADGTLVSGFPVRFLDSLGNSMVARGSPAVKNLDADADLEAAFTNQAGWLYGVNRDGSLVEGFPIKHDGGIEGCPLIADLDSDGFNEICVTGLDAKINLYSTPGVALKNKGWPTYQGNALHTGSPLTDFTGVPPIKLAVGVLQTPHLPQAASAYLVSTVALSALPSMLLDGATVPMEETASVPPLYRTSFTLETGSHRLEVTVESVYGEESEITQDFDVLAVPPEPRWLSSGHGVDLYVGNPAYGPDRVLLLKTTESSRVNPYTPPGDGLKFLIGIPLQEAPAGTQVRFDLPPEWRNGAVQGWNGNRWADAGHVDVTSSTVTIELNHWGWFRLRERELPLRLTPVITLGSVMPNPFRESAQVLFSLSAPDHVRATILDIQGRVLRVVEDRRFPSGVNQVNWNGKDDRGAEMPSGVYFLHIQSSNTSTARRLVRVKGGPGR